jgi:hypothetical protein
VREEIASAREFGNHVFSAYLTPAIGLLGILSVPKSDQIFFAAIVPKFAARDIVDNSVKNARPVGVPGTNDELRVRISRQIRSIRTGRLRTLK